MTSATRTQVFRAQSPPRHRRKPRWAIPLSLILVGFTSTRAIAQGERTSASVQRRMPGVWVEAIAGVGVSRLDCGASCGGSGFGPAWGGAAGLLLAKSVSVGVEGFRSDDLPIAEYAGSRMTGFLPTAAVAVGPGRRCWLKAAAGRGRLDRVLADGTLQRLDASAPVVRTGVEYEFGRGWLHFVPSADVMWKTSGNGIGFHTIRLSLAARAASENSARINRNAKQH